LPLFPREVMAKLTNKELATFGPGTKGKSMVVEALYDDMRKRGIM